MVLTYLLSGLPLILTSFWRSWSRYTQGWEDRNGCAIGLNLRTVLVPLELIVPGLRKPICMQKRFKRGKKQVQCCTEIVERCSKSLCVLRKAEFFTILKQDCRSYLRILKWNLSCKKFKFRIITEDIHMVRHEASKTVETILIVYYIHTQLYIQAGGVDKRTVHFQHMEERTEGTYSPYCSGYSRCIGSLHT